MPTRWAEPDEVAGPRSTSWCGRSGWTDKLPAVLGQVNPVALPSCPSRCPSRPAWSAWSPPTNRRCSAWWAELAPALAAGNTVVAVISESWPLPALDFGEVLGVSDLPGGVVNLLSGRRAELAPALGAHRDLNAIVDAAGDDELGAELDRLAAETVKRTRHVAPVTSYEAAAADDDLVRLEAVTELKTAWHPVGSLKKKGGGAQRPSASRRALRPAAQGRRPPRAWAEA